MFIFGTGKKPEHKGWARFWLSQNKSPASKAVGSGVRQGDDPETGDKHESPSSPEICQKQLVKPDTPDQTYRYGVDFIQRPEQELDGVVDGAGDFHDAFDSFTAYTL